MLVDNKIVCMECKKIIELKAMHISIDMSNNSVFADDKKVFCKCGSEKITINSFEK